MAVAQNFGFSFATWWSLGVGEKRIRFHHSRSSEFFLHLAINFGIFGSGRFSFAGLSTLSLLVFLCALPTLLKSLSFLFEPKTKSFLRRHCFQQLPLLTVAAQHACNHSRESLLGRQFRKRPWKQSVENNLKMIANNFPFKSSLGA